MLSLPSINVYLAQWFYAKTWHFGPVDKKLLLLFIKTNKWETTEAAARGVLREKLFFAKFTGKHPCQSLLFKEVHASGLQLYQKETLAQVFFCEFCEFFNKTYSHSQDMSATSMDKKKHTLILY